MLTDRYVSAISSSRMSAPCTSAPEPFSAIHPSFTCGRPSDFDAPPSPIVNTVSSRSRTEADAPGAGSIG